MSRNESSSSAGQLNVVELCHDYAVLDMHDRVGLRLSRSERRSLDGLRRLLLGDPSGRRRRHRRLPLHLDSRVLVGQARVDGRALNISGAGIFVVLPLEVPRGEALKVVVGPENGQHHRFNAEVRWSRKIGGQIGHGLRFSAVPVRRQQPVWERSPASVVPETDVENPAA